jgi:hypothetical protein
MRDMFQWFLNVLDPFVWLIDRVSPTYTFTRVGTNLTNDHLTRRAGFSDYSPGLGFIQIFRVLPLPGFSKFSKQIIISTSLV